MNSIALTQYLPVNKIFHKRKLFYCMVFSFVLLASFFVLAVTPGFAFAGIIEDAMNNIKGFLVKLCIDMTNACWWVLFNWIKSLINMTPLTQDWSQLFGGGSTKIYEMTVNICNASVKPIATSILALVFMMQFLKIASKTEKTGSMPMLQEILVFAVLFVIFNYCINHAHDICGGIYTVVLNIAKGISQMGALPFDQIGDFIDPGTDDLVALAVCDLGVCINMLIVMALGSLGGLLLFIVAQIMTYMRAIQLYLFAMFSPIPMSLLGFEETKSWGVGFFKSFAAVALAGAILLAILFMFPIVLTVVGIGDPSQNIMTGTDPLGSMSQFFSTATGAGGIITAVKILALVIMFIIAIAKSGSWARDVLGS